jgi:carbon storage regulator CsrA
MRSAGREVHIGNDITVTVLEVIGNRVRLGVQAPRDVGIVRGELKETWVEVTLQPRDQDTLHLSPTLTQLPE